MPKTYHSPTETELRSHTTTLPIRERLDIQPGVHAREMQQHQKRDTYADSYAQTPSSVTDTQWIIEALNSREPVDAEFMVDANCLDLPDSEREQFFSADPFEQTAAAEYCRSCPVRTQCVQYADKHFNLRKIVGVYGATPATLKAAKQQQRETAYTR